MFIINNFRRKRFLVVLLTLIAVFNKGKMIIFEKLFLLTSGVKMILKMSTL